MGSNDYEDPFHGRLRLETSDVWASPRGTLTSTRGFRLGSVPEAFAVVQEVIPKMQQMQHPGSSKDFQRGFVHSHGVSSSVVYPDDVSGNLAIAGEFRYDHGWGWARGVPRFHVPPAPWAPWFPRSAAWRAAKKEATERFQEEQVKVRSCLGATGWVMGSYHGEPRIFLIFW